MAEATIKAKTVTNFIVDVYDIWILAEFVFIRNVGDLFRLPHRHQRKNHKISRQTFQYYNLAFGATSVYPKFHEVEGKSCVYVVC